LHRVLFCSARCATAVPETKLPSVRQSSASSYSPRKASIGSALDARLAGSAEGASVSSSIAMGEKESKLESNEII